MGWQWLVRRGSEIEKRSSAGGEDNGQHDIDMQR
jgi:hypothetical protein